MGYVAPHIRELELIIKHNFTQHDQTTLSRTIRAIQNNLKTQKSLINSQKMRELKLAKASYDEARLQRPKMKSENGETVYYDSENNVITKEQYEEVYKTWSEDFADIKEDYQTIKTEIENYYDAVNEDIEAEATLKQSFLEEEEANYEALSEAYSKEMSSLKESISKLIQDNAISLKG